MGNTTLASATFVRTAPSCNPRAARGWIDMNALEPRLTASSEQHRGAAMNELRNNDLRNEPRGEARGELRVVKKYPNRRLYDTVESRYITLADIRRLVME